MVTKSITITIDEKLLSKSDEIVAQGKYTNRSRLIEEAIANYLQELDEDFIGEQAALLDSTESEAWFEGELASWQEEY